MVKYRVSWGKIEECEVLKETEKTITYTRTFFNMAAREYKTSSLCQWLDTWDEARQYLIDEATKEVDDARARYNKATIALENAKAMRRP